MHKTRLYLQNSYFSGNCLFDELRKLNSMRRIVRTLDLKNDPELIAFYRSAHTPHNIWKEVVDGIKSVGIETMDIYIKDNRLTMILEIPDDVDTDEAFSVLSTLPRQSEWEDYVGKAQECEKGSTSSGKWKDMERIFSLSDHKEQRKKVFVSGCYDMLHSGHVAFFREAATYGDLYVGIGSDSTIKELKNRSTVYSESERLYMVRSIRHVKDAFINSGSGMMDFVDIVDRIKPDIFIVNSDGGSEIKREFCRQRGIEYIELERIPEAGLKARSTTSLRSDIGGGLPYRVDIAGTWIDQPYVSQLGSGWAITASIEPTRTFMERGGMSTSTRNAARKIWPYELPSYNEEMLARLLFCFENDPENEGHISGAQDAIGICMTGVTRHFYNGRYWPSKIESCHDEEILSWLEEHLVLAEMFPRRPGCSVVEGKDITPEKVKSLTSAADRTWEAIMNRDIDAFAQAYSDSFNAQIAMFPAMMAEGVAEHIENWKPLARAWKMLGAGGGGHLMLVVDKITPELIDKGAIRIKIRRKY